MDGNPSSVMQILISDRQSIYIDGVNRIKCKLKDGLYTMILNEASVKQQIENGLSGMRPGELMMAVSKSLGSTSAKFLGKHLLSIIKNAAKSGKVKASELGAAVKDFSKKNVEDMSGIDWEHVEIDPSSMTFKCVFEGDAKKKIDEFMKQYEDSMKDVKKEIEEQDKKLADDVKKAKVDMDDDEIAENGVAVASVIDDEANKGKKGKELKKKIEGAIKQDKEVKKVMQDANKLKKAANKAKVDSKFAKMSDEELAKKDKEIEKKIAEKSDASKANDKLRAKLKSAIQKNISKDFKKSVKTMFVSTSSLKKTVAKNLKSGLAIEKIEEPRAVCISVVCGKKDFKKILSEAASEGKVIDITNGSKDKNVQKIVDYIKDKVTSTIGKDKLGKFYAYRKQSGNSGNDLIYVFAGVKESELSESYMVSEAGGPSKQLAAKLLAAYIDKNKDSDVVKNSFATKSATSVLKRALASDSSFAKMSPVRQKSFIEQTAKGLGFRPGFGEFTPEKFDAMKEKFDIGGASSVSDIADAASSASQATDNMASISKMSDNDISNIVSNGGKSVKDMTASLKNIAPKNEEDAQLLVAKLVKAGADEDTAAKAVYNSCEGQSWFPSSSDDAMQFKEELELSSGDPDKILTSTSIGQAADTIAADIPDGPSDSFGKVPQGFANLGDGRVIPSFSYAGLGQQIKDLDDIFADGVVDEKELERLTQVGDKLSRYTDWMNQNAGSNDPLVQQKMAMLQNLTNKYDQLLGAHQTEMDSALAQASDARTGATEATRAASKQMADNEEMQKAAGGWKKALGLDKMFTALGVARLAAKTTGVVLNNGKGVVDALGAYAMKNKEDKNVIAQMNFILQNGEDGKSKFDDTKFSVRYDAGDNKWHATCLDNRKMKFPEEEVIKKVLATDEGKKFKKFCLGRWKSIFRPDDERRSIVAYVLGNFDKLGLDASKETKELAKTMQSINDNFEKIEQEFK